MSCKSVEGYRLTILIIIVVATQIIISKNSDVKRLLLKQDYVFLKERKVYQVNLTKRTHSIHFLMVTIFQQLV